jgi:hypothetical protein
MAAPVPAALVRQLHRVSGGNPYFLGELVRWLRSQDRLSAVDLSRHLPEEIRELTRRRIAPLGLDTWRLLAVAATIGQDFDVALLHEAAGLPPEQVFERLTAAAHAGLVRESPRGHGRLEFVHALVRETLYHDLLQSSRITSTTPRPWGRQARRSSMRLPPATARSQRSDTRKPWGITSARSRWWRRSMSNLRSRSVRDSASAMPHSGRATLCGRGPPSRRPPTPPARPGTPRPSPSRRSASARHAPHPGSPTRGWCVSSRTRSRRSARRIACCARVRSRRSRRPSTARRLRRNVASESAGKPSRWRAGWETRRRSRAL